MEIIEIGDGNREEWASFVDSRPEAHLYHDYRWKQVLEDSFGHKAHYLMARDNGKTAGILPLVFLNSKIMTPAIISLPFLNYGGILAQDDDIAAALLEKAKEQIGKPGPRILRCVTYQNSQRFL